jgi:hypothetical protein
VVGERGLAYVYRGTIELCLWPDLAEIREVFTHESLQVLKVPGAAIKNIDRSLIVKRKDGKEFRFTVNSIKGISRLARHLKEVSEQHKIPWQVVEQ